MGVVRGAVELDRMFARLGWQMQKKLMMGCLKKGGEVLLRQTRNSLVSTLKESATSSRHKRKPLIKGVVMKEDKAYNELVVSIKGDFRLKWFEVGTRERTTKRFGKSRPPGLNRGQMEATNFFLKARQDSGPIEEAMGQEFQKQLGDILK